MPRRPRETRSSSNVRMLRRRVQENDPLLQRPLNLNSSNTRNENRYTDPIPPLRSSTTMGNLRTRSQHAFGSMVNRQTMFGDRDDNEWFAFFDHFEPYLANILGQRLRSHPSLKFSVFVEVVFKKIVERGPVTRSNEHERFQYIVPILASPYHILTAAPDLLSEEDVDEQTIHDSVMERRHTKLNEVRFHINNMIDKFIQGGSEWTIDYIRRMHITTLQFTPAHNLHVAAVNHPLLLDPGHGYIELPEWVQLKKACINIKNDHDNNCFMYCMECVADEPERNPQRVGTYHSRPRLLNYTGITFPVKVNDLERFEKLNPHVAVNVFCLRNGHYKHGLDVLRLAYRPHATLVANLLLLEGDEFNHWVVIKNMSRILSGNGNRYERVYCYHCMMSFPGGEYGQAKLRQHQDEFACVLQKPKSVEYPSALNAFHSYTNLRTTVPVPFAIFADFECALISVPLEQSTMGQYTTIEQKHMAISFGMKRVCLFDDAHTTEYQTYTTHEIITEASGKKHTDTGVKFLQYLNDEYDKMVEIMSELNHPPEASASNIVDYVVAATCCVCRCDLNATFRNHPIQKRLIARKKRSEEAQKIIREVFSNSSSDVDDDEDENVGPAVADLTIRSPSNKENEDVLNTWNKVQLYDTRKAGVNYVGAAHGMCAQLFMEKTKCTLKVPVLFHNLKNYDANIIVRSLQKQKRKFSAIPLTARKFLSFSLDNFHFIDTINFLGGSLEKNVEATKKDGRAMFPLFLNEFAHLDEVKQDLLMQKGVYPYEWMNDDFATKLHQSCLPPPVAFASKLRGDAEATPTDYAHAQRVWTELQCRQFHEYHDLYLKTDVLLLADVFLQFRKACWNEYNLDILHYVSLPGFAFDAVFYTAHQLSVPRSPSLLECELFSQDNFNAYLWIEKSVRGGISMIRNRYAKANQDGFPDFDENAPRRSIIYVDANALYSYAMSQPMPLRNYQWYENDVDAFTSDHIMAMDDFGTTGYVLEVDVDIPHDLHNKFSQYPLMPMNRAIAETEISPYSRELNKQSRSKHDGATKKLVCDLHNKRNYVVHYRYLKLCLQLGYVLRKVHRYLSFQQTPFLRAFVKSNSDKRAATTSVVRKDMYKLQNNAIYGKFLQNDRKHRTVKLCTTPSQMERAAREGTFRNLHIIDDDLVITEHDLTRMKCNKPILVGFTILEISKWLMANFYYNVMHATFGDRVKLLATDTDSLIMEIESQSWYDELKAFPDRLHWFDFSNYPTDHRYYDTGVKEVYGHFKDETKGDPIVEFVGLKAKMYSCMTLDEKQKHTAKGVGHVVRRSVLTHDLYRNVLMQPNDHFQLRCPQTRIGTLPDCQLVTLQSNKITLTSSDSKVYQVDHISSLPYGHKDIEAATVPV